MREYMLKRYHKRRSESIEKLGGKCVVCGVTENLEIDHIDRTTKTMAISGLWSANIVRYEAELKLCQLLCEEHHKQKTSRENSVEHGGGKTGKRNCYCELCAPLKRAYARERRQLNTRR
jgi:hypothetical protein